MQNNIAGEKITENSTSNFESHTTGVDMELGDDSVSLGKFKDVKSLFDAYNSLQAEFTRRCQKVKELERENERLNNEITHASKSSLSIGDDIEDEKLAQERSSKVDDGTEKLSTNQSLQEQIDYYKSSEYLFDAINNNQSVKDEIINRYLNSVQSSKPTVKLITGNGQSVVTPPSTPKTLVEAGEIARQIFEN